ncbi:MAG: MMPL family transporter [Candidatus Methanospirareceae archaeon]
MEGKRASRRVLEKYARFISYHAPLVLAIFIVFTIFTGYQASLMKTAGATQKDWLPEDIEVVNTYNLIADQFAGSFSRSTISVETSPEYANSMEIRDMREPEALRYVGVLAERAKLVYGVVEAESAADIIKKANGGRIPSSLRSVKSLLKNNEMLREVVHEYVSDDYTMSLVRLKLLEDVDASRVVEGLREAIRGDKPPGVEVGITGDPVMEVALEELAEETMRKTSFVSFILIILILLIVFVSIKYGLIPLLTIALGTIWAYGVLNFVGFRVTPETSGVMAMIMGIGIDFGIQVTKRFRYELQRKEPKEAMVETINSVFYPLTITTIAAVVGFLALRLGKLPVMKDMGVMMAVGVIFCMVAAITVVPAVLVLLERKFL